jgi:hypothetical protein
MRGSKSWLGWSCSVLALASLIQCGGKKSSSSSDVKLEVIPEKPIVITANTTVNGNAVPAPWVKFSVNLTNNSDKPLTIVAVTAKIYAPSTQDATDWAEDPASQASSTDTNDCTYSTYGTWDPKESKALELPGVTACKVSPHFFYVGGLKKPTGASYRYKIVFTPIGWYGTEAVPTDRLDIQVSFTTQ